ncbi:MAG: hypothetical protein KatS3mg130_2087 [Candidatus Sumerlaea sp.]|nr:MAG: hypothetical protein KatS3mg130_2087 [Candidatus Sumerlaea sp.]
MGSNLQFDATLSILQRAQPVTNCWHIAAMERQIEAFRGQIMWENEVVHNLLDTNLVHDDPQPPDGSRTNRGAQRLKVQG